MPSSHKTLAAWYRQMGQLCESGTALASAFRIASGPPKSSREAIARQIEQGKPIVEILVNRPKWLPKADCIYLCAAMNTGRLPQTFMSLSEKHDRMRATKAKLISKLAYPIGVLHIAALVLPISMMINYEVGFEWSLKTYLTQAGMVLIPTWLLLGTGITLSKKDSPLLPRLLRCVPVLRGYSKAQALADFSSALSIFIETGVLVQTAWHGAAKLCKDPGIQKATKALQPVFERGENPAPLLNRFKCFPEYFVAYYNSGTESGKLDETLGAAARQFQVEADQKLSASVILYPSILSAVVAGFIIYSIFKIFGGYLNMITDMM